MAKILFLHPNFPAQFRAPCESLAKGGIHDIRFLCQTHYGREINGIQKLVLKGNGSHEKTLAASKNELERMQYRSKVYRQAFSTLSQEKWQPDVVVSHCGWGSGLFVKEIWPNCRFIVYLEWWFSSGSALHERMRENPHFQLSDETLSKLMLRNMPIASEMAIADEIVAPTSWQRDQLPRRLKKQCQVIYDSIDKTVFFPEPAKQSAKPVLTYGTRGMEPMRGFPEFIEILPQILKKWPQLNVEIAGTDTINYGGIVPKAGSWKKWANEKLIKAEISDRVHWLGRLSFNEYANWLKSSWCHVYLSEPFVTSWSLIEACHCAIPMVATQSPSTDEFSHLNPFMLQIDHHNSDELAEAINDRIRFSANPARGKQVSTDLADQNSAFSAIATLAGLIADPEAATSI